MTAGGRRHRRRASFPFRIAAAPYRIEEPVQGRR